MYSWYLIARQLLGDLLASKTPPEILDFEEEFRRDPWGVRLRFGCAKLVAGDLKVGYMGKKANARMRRAVIETLRDLISEVEEQEELGPASRVEIGELWVRLVLNKRSFGRMFEEWLTRVVEMRAGNHPSFPVLIN